MGNMFSGTISHSVAAECLDTLQDKGLKAFASQAWGLNKWNARSVFGYDFNRNQAFKVVVEHLSAAIKFAFKEAEFKPTDLTGIMSNFIATNFAHHIMKCLLATNKGIKVEVDYQEVSKGLLLYELPKYGTKSIKEFQQQWLLIDKETVFSIDTENKEEQNLLSVKLAAQIIEITGRMDVKAFVVGAISAFLQTPRKDRAERQATFSQAGNSTLFANKGEYTKAAQDADFLKTVHSDLAKRS